MCTVISKIIKQLRQAHITELTVLGHDQIDEDSCVSSLLMCFILNYYDIKATFKILDPIISQQTVAVLLRLGYDLMVFQVEKLEKNEKVFLVDHYQTNHQVEVVGCIDHHPTEKQFDYMIYDNGNASACSKKIFDYMVEDKMPLTREIIEMVAYAVVIDTFDFKSPRGKKVDQLWLEEVVETYDLDHEEMVRAALSLTDLKQPIGSLAMSSLKAYQFHGKQVKATYILVKEEPYHIEDLLSYLQNCVRREGLALWVFLAIDVVRSQTTEYRIGETHVDKIAHEKLSSRAQEIMPAIEKILSE